MYLSNLFLGGGVYMLVVVLHLLHNYISFCLGTGFVADELYAALSHHESSMNTVLLKEGILAYMIGPCVNHLF